MIAEHAIDWTARWREEGLKKGRKEGWKDGRKEGWKDGRKEGRKEGRQQGEAAVLLRLLRRRYGSLDREIEERVKRADARRLLDWADRFVTATTLDEIFDGRGS